MAWRVGLGLKVMNWSLATDAMGLCLLVVMMCALGVAFVAAVRLWERHRA